MAGRPNGSISSKKMGSSHGHPRYSQYALTLMTPRVFRMPYPLSSYCEIPMEDPTDPGLFHPLPIDLFPVPGYPRMPGEGQSTLILNWFRICSIINLPYPLVSEWKTELLEFKESTWAELRSKSIKGNAGPQTTSQPNGRSVDVPDMTCTKRLLVRLLRPARTRHNIPKATSR